MRSKRLSLCQKPLFDVPNHLTEQWTSEQYLSDHKEELYFIYNINNNKKVSLLNKRKRKTLQNLIGRNVFHS